MVLVEKIFENVDEWTDRRLGVIGFALKYATCEFHVNKGIGCSVLFSILLAHTLAFGSVELKQQDLGLKNCNCSWQEYFYG